MRIFVYLFLRSVLWGSLQQLKYFTGRRNCHTSIEMFIGLNSRGSIV